MLNNLNVGWQLVVLGMGTVFLILYLLSVLLKNVGKVLGAQDKTQSIGVSTTSASTAPAPVVEIPTTDNKNAKVAAVMAAIQLVMGDTEYRVISIKPAENPNWKQVTYPVQDFTYGRKGK